MYNERTLSLIFQFLNDHGLHASLKELENETGVLYSEIEHPSKGNELCCILEEYEQIQNSLKEVNLEDDSEKSLEQELLVQEHFETASKLVKEFSSLHDKGVLTVRFSPHFDERIIFASTSADKTIKVWDVTSSLRDENEKPQLLCSPSLSNRTPFLCVDFHPKIAGLLITGSMDGNVAIVAEVDKNEEGKVLFNKMIHNKYVVRVKWGIDFFVSASYDKSVCYFKIKGDDINNFEFEEIKRWSFGGNVEAIELTNNDKYLIVSVRDDNYLNYIDLETFEINRVNMNSLGDDHVSFTAMHLSVSPTGNQLLVQTDRDRIIVMRTHSSIQLRNLYGANNNSFSQPRALWHNSGKFIYGTSQTNQIIKWDVVTQNVDVRLSGHVAYPRDIDYHPSKELLISGSYDRTIRIWGI